MVVNRRLFKPTSVIIRLFGCIENLVNQRIIEIVTKELVMKIDTSNPRLPINRLKRPLKQNLPLSENENPIEQEENSNFSETFERLLLKDGAERFEKWLEKLDLK